MTLVTVFQFMCVVCAVGLFLTVVTQWKNLVHKH